MYTVQLGTEEEWSKSIKYGNLYLEDLKNTQSNQTKFIKKMVTLVSGKNYKSHQVVHSNDVTGAKEGGTANKRAQCNEDGFISI